MPATVALESSLLPKNSSYHPPSFCLTLSLSCPREFCRQHSGMLFPAFTLQRKVRSKIVSEAFWKVINAFLLFCTLLGTIPATRTSASRPFGVSV